jgi:spore coat polysaccharide biosynthesis protein SpsF
MKIVATLACRSNSNRLYGKPLQKLMSTTVLDYMVQRLTQSGKIADIVLAISEAPGNEAFVYYAKSKNIKYVLGDDKDVLKRLIDACELANGDTVFRVTTESPLTYLEGLDYAAESHASKNADYTVYAKLPDGVTFELIKLEALKISHEKGDHRHRSELCTLYINENKNDFLLNILDVEESWQRPNYRLTIDYPEDLILLRNIFRYFGGDDFYIPYKDVIAYLDENPEQRAIVDNINKAGYIKPYH